MGARFNNDNRKNIRASMERERALRYGSIDHCPLAGCEPDGMAPIVLATMVSRSG